MAYIFDKELMKKWSGLSDDELMGEYLFQHMKPSAQVSRCWRVLQQVIYYLNHVPTPILRLIRLVVAEEWERRHRTRDQILADLHR